MISLADFAAHLTLAARQCRPRLEVGLARVGTHTETLAAAYIGHPMPGWAPLSNATMEGFRHPYGFWIPGKVSLGYTGKLSAQDPLLRTGAMRKSIELAVHGLSMVVGSRSKVALFQEMGTHNPLTGDIPPRPFLAMALRNSLPYAGDVFGDIAVSLLNPTARLLVRP